MTVLIVRDQTGNHERAARESALAAACTHAGQTVLLAPELYHLPEDSPLWTRLAALPAVQVFTWNYPRPTEWLLRRHGVGREALQVYAIDAFATVADALAVLPAAEDTGGVPEIVYELSPTPRWYPVVDESRCVQCRHCLQFCLFGVYSLDAQERVTVTQPDACKTGCPACSRICPQGAIIFPLYEKDPAIAGAPGCFPEPDATARKMYYTRTKLPCPQCGATAVPAAPTGDLCPECGRPTLEHQPDELDDLIAQLDALAEGER